MKTKKGTMNFKRYNKEKQRMKQTQQHLNFRSLQPSFLLVLGIGCLEIRKRGWCGVAPMFGWDIKELHGSARDPGFTAIVVETKN